MTIFLYILLVINYMIYFGMFFDKVFSTKKEAIFSFIPFCILGITIYTCMLMFYRGIRDVWNNLK